MSDIRAVGRVGRSSRESSHAGEVFHRVPRGTITALYRALFDNDGGMAFLDPALTAPLLPLRSALAPAPFSAPTICSRNAVGGRLEGKSVQKVRPPGG